MSKEKLGAKWDCFSCGMKFYDFGKPEPICPRCGANQTTGDEGEVPASIDELEPDEIEDDDELESDDDLDSDDDPDSDDDDYEDDDDDGNGEFPLDGYEDDGDEDDGDEDDDYD